MGGDVRGEWRVDAVKVLVLGCILRDVWGLQIY